MDPRNRSYFVWSKYCKLLCYCRCIGEIQTPCNITVEGWASSCDEACIEYCARCSRVDSTNRAAGMEIERL